MNLFGRHIALALGLLCTTVLAEREDELPIKSLKLRDGSTLTAVVEALHIPMTTPYGEVEVPVSMIRNIGRQEIHARFAPARRLVLITDERGNTMEDWSVWLWPEVR